jgi:pyruvate/2-oxoglutarate dehydrogenase complex dihydrolipoamide dehydrogenase (E3) component
VSPSGDRHDLVVIGAGVGGLEVAHRAAEAGLDVLVVESGLVGGECPYWGCVPSKAMTRAGQVLGEALRVGELAGDVTVRPDWALLAARVRAVSEGWEDRRAVARLRAAGAQLLRGRGVIAGPGEVEVDGRRVAGRRGVVIGTGTQPVIPPVAGLASVPFWTNRGALEAATCPRSLIVLGGGAIGLELGQVFCRFGSEVTILEAADRVLGMEEPENAAALTDVLRSDGILVRTGVTATRVASSPGGISVDASDGFHAEAERLLVATGRRPDLHRLQVDRVGLDPDADLVPTDAHLRAGERLWAVGDVTGHGAFTHVAYYQAQIAAADILGREHEPADYTAVPRVTFTDPELGSVGLTGAEARRRGMEVRVGMLPIAASDRGWLYGRGADLGVIKVVADATTGTLVGASVLGPVGGETAALLALAIRARIPVATLQEVIYPYPTFARALRGALRRLA